MIVETLYKFKDFNLRRVSYFVNVKNRETITLCFIEKSTNPLYSADFVNPTEAAKILISNEPVHVTYTERGGDTHDD